MELSARKGVDQVSEAEKMLETLRLNFRKRFRSSFQSEGLTVLGATIFDHVITDSGLLALIEAGQAMANVVGSSISHVSHGGPTRDEAEKVRRAWDAAWEAMRKYLDGEGK